MLNLLAIFVLIGTLLAAVAARFGPVDCADEWVDRWTVLALSVALASVLMSGLVLTGAA